MYVMHAAAAAALSQKKRKRLEVRDLYGMIWQNVGANSPETCETKKKKTKAKQKRGLESEWKYEKSCALSLSLGSLEIIIQTSPTTTANNHKIIPSMLLFREHTG